jgi:SH3 domain protein
MIYAVFPAWADTRYVTDRMVISMREERSPESPAVAYIIAETPVEVLMETEDYLFVRIPNGQEGWVRSKYIMTQRPKSMVIKDLNIKIAELENQIATMGKQEGAESDGASDARKIYEFKIKNLETLLAKEKQSSAAIQKELKDVKNRNKQLQTEVGKLSEQNKGLATKGDGSENLRNEIKRLQQTNQTLNQEIDRLASAEQDSLLPSAVKWFLAGGGVLLLGLILGRLVPRKNPYGY